MITDSGRTEMTAWFTDKYKSVLDVWLPFFCGEIDVFKKPQQWTSCQFKRSDAEVYQKRWCRTDHWEKKMISLSSFICYGLIQFPSSWQLRHFCSAVLTWLRGNQVINGSGREEGNLWLSSYSWATNRGLEKSLEWIGSAAFDERKRT